MTTRARLEEVATVADAFLDDRVDSSEPAKKAFALTHRDARKLLALVEAVGELLESLNHGDANDCGYAVSILTEKYTALTTDPEARDGIV